MNTYVIGGHYIVARSTEEAYAEAFRLYGYTEED
jgi:hypothetical protein